MVGFLYQIHILTFRDKVVYRCEISFSYSLKRMKETLLEISAKSMWKTASTAGNYLTLNQRGKYTQKNIRIGPFVIVERLDIFLVQSSFRENILQIVCSIIPCLVSDDRSIKCEIVNSRNLGPIPFRFNSLWAESLDLGNPWSLCMA